MDTERGVLNTGVYWWEKGRASGRERWGGIAWGEMPNVGEGEKKSKAHCHVCTYATVLHALLMYPKTYNPIKNKKKKSKKKGFMVLFCPGISGLASFLSLFFNQLNG